jgi:hypothetical protein
VVQVVVVAMATLTVVVVQLIQEQEFQDKDFQAAVVNDSIPPVITATGVVVEVVQAELACQIQTKERLLPKKSMEVLEQPLIF